MKATQLEHGKFQSSIFKLGKELGESGAEILTRIDEDDAFRHKVANYMLLGAPDPKPASNGLTLEIAKAIMGEDKVIGPDQLRRLGVDIDCELLRLADRVPYLPGTLVRHKETHLLVFGTPVTIEDIAKGSEMGMRWRLPSGNAEVMLSSSPTRGWFLIRRSADYGVGDHERLATVVEAYYTLSLHKMTNKRQWFLKGEYGVCQETSAGGEVCFGLGSAFVGNYKDGSYDYWAVKDAKATELKITVVLPDDLAT